MPPKYEVLTAASAKLDKSRVASNVETALLYLYPTQALCPASTPACRAACLVHAGHARMFPSVNDARRARTRLWETDPEELISRASRDLHKLAKYAAKYNMIPAARFNGTSDIAPIALLPLYRLAADLEVVTYEYTKRRDVFRLERHTTYSMAEPASERFVTGQAHAVVFEGFGKSRPLPPTFRGYRVIDGDLSDARFLDREAFGLAPDETYIVGLRMKTVPDARRAFARAAGFSV